MGGARNIKTAQDAPLSTKGTPEASITISQRGTRKPQRRNPAGPKKKRERNGRNNSVASKVIPIQGKKKLRSVIEEKTGLSCSIDKRWEKENDITKNFNTGKKHAKLSYPKCLNQEANDQKPDHQRERK